MVVYKYLLPNHFLMLCLHHSFWEERRSLLFAARSNEFRAAQGRYLGRIEWTDQHRFFWHKTLGQE
jgi:hypothetical protein